MATATVRSRRRPVRAVQQVRRNSRPAWPETCCGWRLSRPARTAYYGVIGTVGLVALAVAIVGPKRLEREVIKPLRNAIEPQAEKL